MKKFLQFSGLIALAAGLVGLILIMSTHSVVGANAPADNWYSGVSAIFGGGNYKWTISGWGITVSDVAAFTGRNSSSALFAWIFALVALLGLVAGAVLPLLKVKGFDKFAGLVNLCSVLLLVTAGILLFFTVVNFAGQNGWNSTENAALGGGWVVGAILFLAAGAIAICPAVADFLGKKK